MIKFNLNINVQPNMPKTNINHRLFQSYIGLKLALMIFKGSIEGELTL